MKRELLSFGLLSLLSCSAAMAADRSVAISTAADYENRNIIAGNILSECGELGSNFSSSTERYLQENGWTVLRTDDVPAADAGKQLKLQLTNAVSAGNAFLGHRKSLSIAAELYEGDQLLDTYYETRNSAGGFLGGFKGSCAVLYRCANTLGNDVAKWLTSKQ